MDTFYGHSQPLVPLLIYSWPKSLLLPPATTTRPACLLSLRTSFACRSSANCFTPSRPLGWVNNLSDLPSTARTNFGQIHYLVMKPQTRIEAAETGRIRRKFVMGFHVNSMRRLLGLCVLSSWVLCCIMSPAMAAETSDDDQPKNFRYYQIWVSQDGVTHFTECKMKGFNLTAYSALPQFVRTDFGGAPLELVFTELEVGLEQPLHSTPQVQFVVTLSGSWYVKTTDGTRHVFHKGDVLFQDNTKTSPADKQPEHYSGNAGDKPCQQMVVQISRPPQVDNPCPF